MTSSGSASGSWWWTSGRLAYDGTLAGLAERVAMQRVLVGRPAGPHADLAGRGARHVGSELDGQRQRLAFEPEQTTAARVLAAVTAQTEVVDLTLESRRSRTSSVPSTHDRAKSSC